MLLCQIGTTISPHADPRGASTTSNYLLAAIDKVYRHPSLELKAKAKIILRILRKPQLVSSIEKRMQELGLGFITADIPRLFEKPSRPYLANGMSSRQTLELLTGHYGMLGRYFSQDAIRQIYGSSLPLLADFLADMGGQVDLHYDHSMEKEGELTLTLALHGMRVYSGTFLLTPQALYIGSLQGSRAGLDEIRKFTKVTHGVRPQNFITFLIRIIARELKLPALRAISNQGHIYKAKKRTEKRIQFDYDTFWQENGGTPFSPLFFDLPLDQPRKEPADMPVNKRALYRRRFEFLDHCTRALSQELAARYASPSGSD